LTLPLPPPFETKFWLLSMQVAELLKAAPPLVQEAAGHQLVLHPKRIPVAAIPAAPDQVPQDHPALARSEE